MGLRRIGKVEFREVGRRDGFLSIFRKEGFEGGG